MDPIYYDTFMWSNLRGYSGCENSMSKYRDFYLFLKVY